jgi:cysteinyl-tRNA synthetase
MADRAHAPAVALSPPGRGLHEAFAAAVDDDLDTPTALRLVREALRAPLTEDERRWLVLDMDFVLGLDLDPAASGAAAGPGAQPAETDLSPQARDLVGRRTQARAELDWAAADRLRDELRDLGLEPIDRADGTSDWRRIS